MEISRRNEARRICPDQMVSNVDHTKLCFVNWQCSWKKIVSIRSRMEALLFAHPIQVSKIQELQRGHLRDSRLNSGHLCFMTDSESCKLFKIQKIQPHVMDFIILRLHPGHRPFTLKTWTDWQKGGAENVRSINRAGSRTSLVASE